MKFKNSPNGELSKQIHEWSLSELTSVKSYIIFNNVLGGGGGGG